MPLKGQCFKFGEDRFNRSEMVSPKAMTILVSLSVFSSFIDRAKAQTAEPILMVNGSNEAV